MVINGMQLCRIHNPKVSGSSPLAATNTINHLRAVGFRLFSFLSQFYCNRLRVPSERFHCPRLTGLAKRYSESAEEASES